MIDTIFDQGRYYVSKLGSIVFSATTAFGPLLRLENAPTKSEDESKVLYINKIVNSAFGVSYISTLHWKTKIIVSLHIISN